MENVTADGPLRGHILLGFAAFSVDDLVRADAHYTAAAGILEQRGEREPARFRFQADHAEAVIGLGDISRAASMLDGMDQRARVFARLWILATAARGRALLLAAQGDLEGALAKVREAIEHHASLAMPFESARTAFVHGRLLRRRNQRRLARAALEESLGELTRLGASLWAAKAAEELARVPVRRAPSGLTPTEEKIARLAAEGFTNREVAERAFISAKTVEANLARVYEKLGVRSRAELGRVMAERALNK
jgi:DNA-binding NarL/FixJ family response regulator